MIKKVLKDTLTGIDNHSYDNGRVLCTLSFLVYFSLSIINACAGHSWGAMDFAAGAAAMAVGFGINIRLKRSTEPKRKKENV